MSDMTNLRQTANKLMTGFLRSLSLNIPLDIINLCISFYFIAMGTFDKQLCGEYMFISDSDDNRNIDTVLQSYLSVPNSAMGSLIIDPTKYQNSIIEWTFKIHPTPKKLVKTTSVYVGIIENNESIDLDSNCFECIKNINYGFQIHDSKRQNQRRWFDKSFCKPLGYTQGCKVSQYRFGEHTIKIGENDENIIIMILDIANKSLCIDINDQGKIDGFFNNVNLTRQYRMTVCLDNQHMKVEIISFEIGSVRFGRTY